MTQDAKKDWAFAWLTVGIGAWLSMESFQYSYESSVLLRALSIAVLLMSMAYMFVLHRRHKKAPEPVEQQAEKSTLIPALIVFGLIVGCALLMPLVGFLLSFFLFIFLAQVVIAKKFKILYLIYSIGLALFIYLVFFGLLGVALPESLVAIDQYFKVF